MLTESDSMKRASAAYLSGLRKLMHLVPGKAGKLRK
jgi:hypothetical protein